MSTQPPSIQSRPANLLPPLAAPRTILLAGLGGGVATLVLFSLAQWSGLAFVMAPFGATCVLAFALPDSPLSSAGISSPRRSGWPSAACSASRPGRWRSPSDWRSR